MKIYQVDAFADALFKGNPAAVCLLEDDWLCDDLMQKIAMENNLSETVFVKRAGECYAIRWFTPTVEVPLCGHATLAAAHVLFNHENFKGDEITFESKDAVLKVTKSGDKLVLDFPIDNIWQIGLDETIDCFNFKPLELWCGAEEYILLLENEKQVQEAICDLNKAAKIDLAGLIITAQSSTEGIDYVYRYFAPKIGIDEDPVTGSNQCLLAPFWSQKLNKTSFIARQASARGGSLWVKLENDRVKIAGKAITYLSGNLHLEEK